MTRLPPTDAEGSSLAGALSDGATDASPAEAVGDDCTADAEAEAAGELGLALALAPHAARARGSRSARKWDGRASRVFKGTSSCRSDNGAMLARLARVGQPVLIASSKWP